MWIVLPQSIKIKKCSEKSIITKFFLDSADVEGNLNLANNSWINVLSSFNKETTYKQMALEVKTNITNTCRYMSCKSWC